MSENEKKSMVECSLGIILHAGNAHSSCMEAIDLASKLEWTKAKIKIDEAKEAFSEAHHIQTDLLTDNAKAISNGENGITPDILMVHAQDHFNSAYICIDLCDTICKLYQQIDDLRKEINELKNK